MFSRFKMNRTAGKLQLMSHMLTSCGYKSPSQYQPKSCSNLLRKQKVS